MGQERWWGREWLRVEKVAGSLQRHLSSAFQPCSYGSNVGKTSCLTLRGCPSRSPDRFFNTQNPYSDTSLPLGAISARMRGQRPVAHQSRYRLSAVSQLPYSVGIARHEVPERTTHRMPASTVRWSWRGRPGVGFCGGSIDATRYHSPSVSGASFAAGGGAARADGEVARWSAHRAAWQRAATAWWAWRHRDHARRNGRCAAASPRARISRRTSGTVRGIRAGSAPPVARVLPAASPDA